MKNICTFLLLLFSLLSVAQKIDFTSEELKWIEANPAITFGYDKKWEPYEMFKDNDFAGVAGEYVKRIEEATGIDLVPLPNATWVESLEKLKDGSLTMAPSCAYSKEREEFLFFTEPYIIDPVVIATRRDHGFVGSMEELNGSKVALPINYWTNELTKKEYPEIIIEEKKTIQDCFDALSYGEVDAVVTALGVISYYINNKGYGNLKVAAPSEYEAVKISMAFTKDSEIFRDICQKVLQTISIQERNRIRKDWISVRYEYAFNWTKAFTWLLVIGGTILFGFILFFLWNRSLKKQINAKIIAENKLNVSLEKITKSEQEKKVLLQEIHHRVKNNLQVITSLIKLQATSSKNNVVENSLLDATKRIQAISLIHEKLYNTSDLKQISAENYIKTLVSDITKSITDSKSVKLIVNTEIQTLNMRDMLPFALILNELITNSIKYAFINQPTPEIEINLEEKNKNLLMKYSDNGQWQNNSKSQNFGTSLIDIFTEQLNGAYNIDKSSDGTLYEFNFAVQAYH